MSASQGFDLLAHAFAAEGVTAHFTLIGDANMYWAVRLARMPGVQTIHVRHEHCAVAMAEGYARATGKVGVASVTAGPGFTQIMTALTSGVRGNVPMVVFAGDTPTDAAYSNQKLDQGPFATATGAHFVPVRNADRLTDYVTEAFYLARFERRPVVLSVPLDLQRAEYAFVPDYIRSESLLPTTQRAAADIDLVTRVAERLATAARPIIIAGRGAMASGAEAAIERLADAGGALLATTLLAKGMFDHHPYGLGIAGAFASDLARREFAAADLVLGFGAGLGFHTTESGYLYPNASSVQIDIAPRGFWQGLRVADIYLRADAKCAAEQLFAALGPNVPAKPSRTAELARAIATEVYDGKAFAREPDTVDPRAMLLELDQVIPKDWDIVVGGSHFFDFVLTHMRGRKPARWHVINNFGAIGSTLSAAIGVAVARGSGKVIAIDGDGGFLMHVQELDTIRRHGVRLIAAVMNDGGYGAEVHRFRATATDPSDAVHGRGTLEAVAAGFGLRGATVRQGGDFARLLAEHLARDAATVWDIHVDSNVASRQFRRIHSGEA